MKKALLILLGTMGMASLSAQNLAGNKVRDNWSIGLNGGIVTPLTHSAFIKNARAVVGLDINKQLSPIYGLTLESNWTINTQSPMTPYHSKTTFDAFNLMLLNRLNLNNIFCKYKGEPALFEVEAVGGIGWLRLLNYYTNQEGANHLASKAGLNLNFNLGQKKAWTVAIKPAVFWDMSMWEAPTKNNHPNFNANYANWEITAGVVYHFKNSNGKHYMSYEKAYDAAEVGRLNATINDLRDQLNAKDKTISDLEKRVDKGEKKAANLYKALKECQEKEPKVITNEKKALESVITFRVGKTTIDTHQMPNVERIATYMKNHKDAKVCILGYASPEGNPEINARLAEQRAEAVKTMLVEKYKIDAARIDARGQGVGDMFEEPDWNRVSICTIGQ